MDGGNSAKWKYLIKVNVVGVVHAGWALDGEMSEGGYLQIYKGDSAGCIGDCSKNPSRVLQISSESQAQQSPELLGCCFRR